MEAPNSPKVRMETPEAERILESAESKIFNGELSDIAEVTYAYTKIGDELHYNRTVFSKFAGVEANEGIEKAFDAARIKLMEKRTTIAEHVEMIDAVPHVRSERLRILRGALTYLDDLLHVTLIGLPFEAEKAWRPHGMTENQVAEAVMEMERLETGTFWGNLRDDPEESADALRRLAREYELGGWRLKKSEKETFRALFEKLGGKKLPIPSSRKGRKKRHEDRKTSNDPQDRQVGRETYVRCFRQAFEAYGISKPVVVEERSSIYDGEDALRIPDSDEYAVRSFSRVLGLIQHEIGTHYLVMENNAEVLGKFRWGRNLQREEWLASIAEGLVNGVGIEEFAKTRANPGVYAGEILTGDELRTLIRLQKRMDGAPKDSEWPSYLRRKRNYPFGYRGVQHKDSSYARGEKEVAEYLLRGGSLSKLHVAKTSIEEVDLAARIAEREGISIRLPKLTEELLNLSLAGKTANKHAVANMAMSEYPFLKDVYLDSPKIQAATAAKVGKVLGKKRK